MSNRSKIVIILTAVMLIMLFGTSVSADNSGNFTVENKDGGYALSYIKSGTQTSVLWTGTFREIHDYFENSDIEYVNLTFLDCAVNDDIELSGNITYNLSGKVTLNGGKLSIETAEVVFKNLELYNFSEENIRVRSGELSIYESSLYLNNSSVTLDYSSEAKLYVSGGKIMSGTTPCIENRYGTVYIGAGEIVSGGNYAIVSKSTAYLFGSPVISADKTSVYTSSPLSLSYNGEMFSGKLSVTYEDVFGFGEMKKVFYGASEESIKNISIYDINENREELTYFETYEGESEKNFAAVYKPFLIEYISADMTVYTEKRLLGEFLTPPDIEKKAGYDFLGWSTDNSVGSYYDFGKGASKNLRLYSMYALSEPEFTINSLEFRFDGSAHSLSLEGLSHPLLSHGTVGYSWYKEGVGFVGSAESVPIKNVSDSGRYMCKILFTYGTDKVYVETPYITVTVKKATVDIPVIEPKVYNGMQQTADISDTALWSIEHIFGVNVGKYPIKITLADSENYEFLGHEGEYIYVDFEIIKAKNSFVLNPSIKDSFFGFDIAPVAKAKFGDVIFKYSDKIDGEFVDTPPTLVGTYYMIAVVLGNENYDTLVSEKIKFSILSDSIVGLSVATEPTKTVYNAFERFDYNGLTIYVTYASGKIETVDGRELSYSYISADNFRYGDSYVIAKYMSESIMIPVSVKRIDYSFDDFLFTDLVFEYDGTKKEGFYKGALPIGLDGYELQCKIVGGGINAGTYSLVAVFSSDSPNYNIPEPITKTLTITPHRVEAIYQNTNFVYDGSVCQPTGYYYNIYGEMIPLVIDGSAINAGVHICAAQTSDTNYILTNPTVEYIIEKADYDLSGIYWTVADFTYDGSVKTVELFGLPLGIKIIGYSNNSARNAGEYTACAVLSYDEKNYNSPGDLTYNWSIKKADYDLSGFVFSDNFPIYDGSFHYPTLEGEMPMGADGIVLGYKFDIGVRDVISGKVKVKITFFHTSQNYNTPAEQYAYVEVSPKPISVVWSALNYTYNGMSHIPRATSEFCNIFVGGAATDAGTYTAIAKSLDSNYTVINGTCEFVIEKADNNFLVDAGVESIYESGTLSPIGTVIGGDVIFKFYSDPLCTNEIEMPTSFGDYYMIAVSEGNKNYKPISSSPIAFKIYKVVVIGITVSMNKTEYKAFEVIGSGDFTLTAHYNDGASRAVDFGEISITYTSSNSFRYGDSGAVFAYGEYSFEQPLTVKRADYDMQECEWSITECEYDGLEKRTELLNLPSGVSVVEYIGGVGTDAGSYKTSVVFDYDRENYNPPVIEDFYLVITKKVLRVPSLPSVVYNGENYSYEPENADLYYVEKAEAKDAGLYYWTFKLKDSRNYVFEGDTDTVKVRFEIKPKKLVIKAYDVIKYLFGEYSEPGYKIIEGDLLFGDSISIGYEYIGGKVVLSGENKNYQISFIDGEIINKFAMTERSAKIFFFTVSVCVILILCTVAIVINREKIYRYVAVTKCRIKNMNAPSAAATIYYAKKDVEEEKIAPEANEVSEVKETIIEDTANEKTEECIKVKEEPEESLMSVDINKAERLITNSLAKNLMKKQDIIIYTDGKKRGIINLDTINENFRKGEAIDVNVLKEKGIIPRDVKYIKVLGRGILDKNFDIYANDFSLSAVKMIVLTGGSANKVITLNKKSK